MSETEKTARAARRELGKRGSRKQARKAADRKRMGIVKGKSVVMQSRKPKGKK